MNHSFDIFEEEKERTANLDVGDIMLDHRESNEEPPQLEEVKRSASENKVKNGGNQ